MLPTERWSRRLSHCLRLSSRSLRVDVNCNSVNQKIDKHERGFVPEKGDNLRHIVVIGFLAGSFLRVFLGACHSDKAMMFCSPRAAMHAPTMQSV